jgi:hypothetical protein
MHLIPLTRDQLTLVESPLDNKIFLEGPAGAGKTSAAVERLLYLMARGARGDSILVLVPQRTLAAPYEQALLHPGVAAGGMVTVSTLGGLARRSLDVFWPLISEKAGFHNPDRYPIFLTLETSQYYMARVARPLFESGSFDSLTIRRNRLYSQIIDNLNKAAVVGFSFRDTSRMLKSAWIGELAQARVYDNAQLCADRFRTYCLEHNLLDFSLQIETFVNILWKEPLFQHWFTSQFRHIFFDNLEEDVPVMHDLLLEWLPGFDSALLVYDQDAGFRSFLGADPSSGRRLADCCSSTVVFSENLVASKEIDHLGRRLSWALNRISTAGENNTPAGIPKVAEKPSIPRTAMNRALFYDRQNPRYFPQMLDWVCEQAACLVSEERVPPGQIAVLAPFLSDALRYSLTDRMERLGLTVRSHRPSRALREEPATHCLLTLAVLAHPGWTTGRNEIYLPTRFDVAYTLLQAIDGLDLVRAQLLAEIVFRTKKGVASLGSFENLRPEMQERITYVLGRRYEKLYTWLENYALSPPEELDYFFSRLFGEVLSQPGFRFHSNFEAGEAAANLVESARKFRWAIGENCDEADKPLGLEYLEMVQDGVVAAQYMLSWQNQPEDAVLLAPAYTYLMANRPVDYQFWLDLGSRAWFERLYQPLTHPFVLSRAWPSGAQWTDREEYEFSRLGLVRLVTGLTRRCRKRVYIGVSHLSEQGYEQKGPLLKAVQRAMRSENPGLQALSIEFPQ